MTQRLAVFLFALLTTVLLSTGVASASTVVLAKGHGVSKALIFTIIILALIVIGVIAVIRFVMRKGRNL